MLLKLFKSNHPYVLFLIPLLGVILWVPTLFNFAVDIKAAPVGETTFLFNWLKNLISFHPKSDVWLALVLLTLESYMLIRLNFKYIFIEDKTYLPSVIFIMFASAITAYQGFHPMLIANLFLLLAFDKAFLFEKSRYHFKRYYESGLFLGLGALFCPHIFLFIGVIWFTLIILRTFNWREWFSSILGLITPLAFYLAISILTDNQHNFLENFKQNLLFQGSSMSFSQYSTIGFGFIGFITIIAIIMGMGVVGVKKISSRKYYTLFFWLLALTIALFFLDPALNFNLSIVLAIPLSIIFSIFFKEIRSKWISEVLFTLILLSVFVIIWFQ